MVIKGLPLAYQKDMQEDKEGAIDAIGALSLSLDGDDRHGARSWSPMWRACGRRPARAIPPRPILPIGWCATLKLPFREAHHVTGRIVAKAAEAGVPLDKLPLKTMQAIEPRITKAVFGVLSVGNSVKSRAAYGGTAPEQRARPGQTLAQAAEKRGRKCAWQEVQATGLPDTMSPPRCGVLWLDGRMRSRVERALWPASVRLEAIRGIGACRLAVVIAALGRLPAAGATDRSNCRAGAGRRRRPPAAHTSIVAAERHARSRARRRDSAPIENRLRCAGNPVATAARNGRSSSIRLLQ